MQPDNNKLIFKAFHSLTPAVISLIFSIQLNYLKNINIKINTFLMTAKSLSSIQKYWFHLSSNILVSQAIIPIVSNKQS